MVRKIKKKMTELQNNIIKSEKKLFDEASKKLENREYENAIKIYRKLLKMDPNLVQVYSNLGYAQFRLKKYREALNTYNKILEKEGDSCDIYINIGLSNHELGKYEEAIENYNKAQKIDPKNEKVYCTRGESQVKLEKYGEAIEDYNNALKLNNKNSLTYTKRGNAYLTLEKYEEAIEDYNKAIEKGAEHCEEIHFNRGNAYSALERYEEAIEDYNKAIQKEVEHCEEMHFNRGNAYLALERYEEAIEDYNKAIEKGAEHCEEIHFRRGNAYSTLERYEEAIEDYNKAIEKGLNTTPGVYSNRGSAYFMLERYEEAIEDYNTSLVKNPNQVSIYIYLGHLYSKIKKYEIAIEKYKQSLEIDLNLNLNKSEAYVGIGNIKYDLKNYNEAIEYYNKALVIKKEADIYINKGLSNFNLKKYEKALFDFDESLKINGKHKKSYFFKMMSLIKLKRYKEAYLIFVENSLGNLYEGHANYIRSELFYNLKKENEFINEKGYRYIRFLNYTNIDFSTIGELLEKNIEDLFEKRIIEEEKILYMYKPISKYSIMGLVNGGVYKSNPNNFNDPFDPYLKRKKMGINEEIKEILKKIKITCFTLNYKNNLMWAHYGNNHKGICIGYKFMKNTSHILQPVNYLGINTSNNRDKTLNKFELLEDEVLTIEELFYRKTKEWQYEEEWRLIHLDEIINNEKSSEEYYKNLELAEIYFGIDCNAYDKDFIKNLLKDNKKIKFYEIEEHENLVLERREIL